MSINNLNGILKGIISSLPSLDVENNYVVDKKNEIVKVIGKDVYLWNDELYNSPLESFFVFNPFNELATHEDSPALAYLRKCVNIELGSVCAKMIPAIINAIVNIKTPNKRQSALVGDIDLGKLPSLLEYLEKVIGKVKHNNATKSVVYVKSYKSNPLSREVDGLTYAGLKSPLLDALAFSIGGGEVLGVGKPKNKGVTIALISILRLLMPSDTEGGIYHVSNKHSTIPLNKGIHDIYSDMIDHLNNVATTLKITDVEIPTVHEDWTNGLSRVAGYLSSIPRDIPGTLGKVRQGVSKEAVAESTRTSARVGGLVGNATLPNMGVQQFGMNGGFPTMGAGGGADWWSNTGHQMNPMMNPMFNPMMMSMMNGTNYLSNVGVPGANTTTTSNSNVTCGLPIEVYGI